MYKTSSTSKISLAKNKNVWSYYHKTYNIKQGHPTAIFGKISVRKTIWDLEFSEHLL